MSERRATRRAVNAAMAGAMLALFGHGRATAQDAAATPEPAAADDGYAPAFSATVIRELGLPEAAVSAGPDGVSAPGQLPAGPVLVTLSALAPWVAYGAVVRPPEGLSEEEATQAALDAAAADLALPDWQWFGGSNTPGEGGSVSFVVDLAPGEYRWAISWYGNGPDDTETMRLVPLTVAAASPAQEVPATVDLAAVDGPRFAVSPDPVPAGPQVWRFANASANLAAQHHAVLWRVPEGTDAEAIVSAFGAIVSGTPVPGGLDLAAMTWVGYFALQSPDTVTWAEFDLAAGNYAVTSFVVDPETGRPQVLDGMATVFRVA